MNEVLMPCLSADMKEGILVSWIKNQNDPVIKGEILFEIETDKVVCEVEATADGYLKEARFGEGDWVKVGDVVAVIEGQ